MSLERDRLLTFDLGLLNPLDKIFREMSGLHCISGHKPIAFLF
jgi:hypothetical protein